MRIVCCDDENLALEVLRRNIHYVLPYAEIDCYEDPFLLLSSLDNRHPDIAFLDIRMRLISGTELARRILAISPTTDIVFVSAFSTYAIQGFEIGASDFLTKPATPEKIQHAMHQLRHRPQMNVENVLKLQCFGTFEASYQGLPLVFKRAKAKELLAYLTAKSGACCTKKELMMALFGEENSSYYGVAKMELIHTLRDAGLSEILINQHNQLAINRSEVRCDFYDWLDAKPANKTCLPGRFMGQYPWGAGLLASLLEADASNF